MSILDAYHRLPAQPFLPTLTVKFPWRTITPWDMSYFFNHYVEMDCTVNIFFHWSMTGHGFATIRREVEDIAEVRRLEVTDMQCYTWALGTLVTARFAPIQSTSFKFCCCF